MKTNIITIWIFGISAMFALYFIGNPFGVYDDVVIIGSLVIYTVRKNDKIKL